MPKMKSHKGVLKRVKVTRNGKVRAQKCGARHLLSSKTRKRKRYLSQVGTLNDEPARKIRKMLGDS